MIFWLDAAFATELIALALGGALLYFLKAHKLHHSFCKFIGYFVIILAFILMACTTYYGTKYWFSGYFEKPLTSKKHKMFKNYKKSTSDHKLPAKKYPKTEDY